MPIDWGMIGAIATIVAILVAIGIAFWQVRKQPSAASVSQVDALTRQPSPKQFDFQLLPLSFNIVLQQEMPWIEIWVYAVNYLNKRLVFDSIRVSQFYLSSGGPTLENIHTADEVSVQPRSSKQILFRRVLVDSEVRAINKTQTRAQSNASFLVAGKAAAGRKQLKPDPVQLSLNGWITGIESKS